MLDKIISFSIRNKMVIGIFTLVWIAWGIYSMTKIPLDAVPDITNNQVQIITTSPNLGTADIEQFVTYPVELSMSNLPGVIELRSISRFGLSVVTIVFEDEMGTYLPRQLVAEKLSEVKEQIPEGFGKPFMAPISTGLGEIYQYTIDPQPGYETVYTPMELRTIQDWIVRRQMAMLPGVVEINSFGGYQKQYEVAISPDRLKSMDVTIAEIFEALEKNNENTGGAYIEKNRMANFIRGEGLLRTKKDIENIAIKNVEGTPVLIGDVAKVQFGHAVRYGAFTKDGKGEAVGGIVMMLKGENSNAVIGRVKERIAEIQKILPEGLEIKYFLNRSKLIKNTTTTVAENLTIGALIVIFVLVLLLGNFRGGLITASIIPLSLLFAFSLMKPFGVWANLMSLGSIDFGIIVDGAVIIVERVVHQITQRSDLAGGQLISKKEMDQLAFSSSSEMMNSAFFGQLIILIVFFPILALTGIEGKMFKPMAMTFGFTVLGAMILCLTYVPMVSSLFLRNKPKSKVTISDKIMNGIQKVYQPIIHWALRKRAITLTLAISLLAGAVFIFTRLGGEFIPKLDEGDIAFQALLKPGTSLTEVVETSTKLQKIVLDNFPEVEQILGRMGVADIPTDPMPIDIVDMFVILKPKDQWVSAETKEELVEKMKEKVSVIPGVNYEFTQPIEMRFNELLTGVREDVSVKLYGEDLDILAAKAQEMAKIIATVKGAADLRVEATKGLPQMTVQYNRSKIAQYGLNIKDLNTILRTAFSGESAGVIFEGEKRFDLVVRLDKPYRKDIENIRNLYVNLPNGNQIPLGEVAEIDYRGGPMQISRDGTKRRIYVGINVRGRDVESTVKEIQQKLDTQLELPPGYYIKYGGTFENLARAKKRLGVVVPIALTLIFILLYIALRSLKQSIMIYMAIPLAAIGGVVSLYIRGIHFSISAGVGFVVLFGVAVLNGLVLISKLNQLKEEGVIDLKERIYQATRERLRPILLTALSAIMGFLPMALSTSAGAEVQRPLATVVIGGLITATFLTLVVIPVLYYLVEPRITPKKNNEPVVTSRITSWLLIPIIGIGLLLSAKIVNAQENARVISLEEAVKIAKSNYPTMKQADLMVQQQKSLKKTVFDIGSTSIFYEREETDGGNRVGNRTIGFSQSIEFPTAYIARSKFRRQQIDLSEQFTKATENELVRNVTGAYYNASFAFRNLQLAWELDSVYKNFERAAKIRYETQETNKLEFLAASGQYQNIKVLLQQAQADYRIAIQELKKWLVMDEPIEIDAKNLAKAELALRLDISQLEQNPLLQFIYQQIEVNKTQVKIEQSKLLPQLDFSYGDQKVEGESGFYTYQAGITIPLWFRPQQGRIQEAKIKTKIAKSRYEEQKLVLNNTFLQRQKDYNKLKQIINYYESQVLPLANEQIEAAKKNYRFGEIDYVAYIQNLDQAIKTKQEYLIFVNQYNLLVTDINFLLGKF